VEEIFAQGHTFTAWQIKKDVGKKTLGDVKKIKVGDDCWCGAWAEGPDEHLA
jgi:hypothetical protein